VVRAGHQIKPAPVAKFKKEKREKKRKEGRRLKVVAQGVNSQMGFGVFFLDKVYHFTGEQFLASRPDWSV
jgi:hypothetical protein